MEKLKLFGERVALVELEEEISGTIVVPQSRQKSYELGTVVSVGDGKTPGSDKVADIYVNKGDVVLFSVPTQFKAASTYVIDGVKNCVIHQLDIIGKLSSLKVAVENFSIAGRWVLMSCHVPVKESLLVIPDTVKVPVEEFKFQIEQLGSAAENIGLVKGDEVIVERNRCNLLEIDDKKYFYCDMAYVYGLVEPVAPATEQTEDSV